MSNQIEDAKHAGAAPGMENALASFAELVRSMPARPRGSEVLLPELLLHRESDVEVYYAPFDWVNRAAKIAVVGITPGLQQMELAFEAARAVLLDSDDFHAAGRKAKRRASFAGPMRANLCRMLDELGVARRLGIESTVELFGTSAGLLHSTSAVRYPVFVAGKNYTGHAPDLLRTPLLRRYVEQVLSVELTALRGALIVPCGDAVAAAIDHLVGLGHVEPSRCLTGFPHPSGGNGWRVRHFNARREQLGATVAAWASGY